MPNYSVPGVYVESVQTGASPISGVSTSVCAFIGKAPRGIGDGFTAISSWTDYVQKCSLGTTANNPFFKDDYMSYNIYNFYQNGGGRAYFGVVKPIDGDNGATAPVAATATLALKALTLSLKAADTGVWANGIRVEVSANMLSSDTETLYDVKIGRMSRAGLTKSDVIYETYTALSEDESNNSYIVDALNNSGIIKVGSVESKVTESFSTLATLSKGSDGSWGTDPDTAKDAAILAMLQKLAMVDDVALIINGGETSDAVTKGILDYCSTRGNIYALLDAPNDTDTDTIVELRKKLGKGLGELHYPWVTMADPVTGRSIEVPPSGMVAGTYVRMDNAYGCWRAAAGAEATLRGATGLVKTLTEAEHEQLFAAGINCILNRANSGIVLFGARSLNQTYVTDDRIDIFIRESLTRGTEWALFEMNDEQLWLKLRASALSFFSTLHQQGALKGTGNGDAYFVVCDSSINTDANTEKGIVSLEYGYATKKPAEFIVHRISKITASA